ncbi:MAG: SO_0444 family Cu/Zn efflux transporter [Candidatus Cloacimonetes bacterium]|nr:SO_0444 family Cu/Zn efflux transporter [Candidatus Cloacimonadota bacterium]
MNGLIKAVFEIYLEIAPYLFIGLTFAGLMHVLLKGDFILRQLGKANLWSIVKASLFGVPLPLCSCGVVPTAMHLKRKGASNGATISFLTSTPQTGIDSIIPTFGMLGWFMGLYRPLTALLMGIITGVVTEKIQVEDKPEQIAAAAQACCLKCECDDPHCTHPSHPWNRHLAEEGSNCGCSSHSGETEHGHEHNSEKHSNKFMKFITYAYGDFIDDISTQLVVGIIIAGLITWLIPDGFFEQYGGKGFLGMIFMIVVGLPMYVCATGSIPIAVSLIMKGISPGAAFVFLVVGPATNAASLTVLASSLGKKVTAVYVLVLTLCALFFGILLNVLVERFGVIVNVRHLAHNMDRSILLDIITVIFSIILLLSFWRKYVPKRKRAIIPLEVEMNVKRYKIEDMHCNHCVKAISAAVEELSGAEDVMINLGEKLLEVKGKASDAEIMAKVQSTGYKIEKI